MRIQPLALVSLLAVVGCGGGDSGSSLSLPPNMPPIVAKSIEFHGGSLYEGSSMRMTMMFARYCIAVASSCPFIMKSPSPAKATTQRSG